ncbi:MAG: hypothetical protein AAB953_02440, partial [Patescibacteria group bacterium]
PWVLTQMCTDEIPVNPPAEQPISQLRDAYSNTPKPEHITELLRPERLGTPQVQNQMRYLTSCDGNRYLLQFGYRIWGKLARKVMTTTGSAHEMIHPIKSLQSYTGLIIGDPALNPNSYIDLMKISNHISILDVIELMFYEIDNGLVEKKDFEEILALASGNLQFATHLREFKDMTSLLVHLPLTETLICGPLELSQGEIVDILALKFATGKFDKEAIKTTKMLLETDGYEYAQSAIRTHDGIMALLEQDGKTSQLSEEEAAREKARADLQIDIGEHMRGVYAKLDKDKIAATISAEKENPPPTVVTIQNFNLEAWTPRNDDVIILRPAEDKPKPDDDDDDDGTLKSRLQ